MVRGERKRISLGTVASVIRKRCINSSGSGGETCDKSADVRLRFKKCQWLIIGFSPYSQLFENSFSSIYNESIVIHCGLCRGSFFYYGLKSRERVHFILAPGEVLPMV